MAETHLEYVKKSLELCGLDYNVILKKILFSYKFTNLENLNVDMVCAIMTCQKSEICTEHCTAWLISRLTLCSIRECDTKLLTFVAFVD